MKRRPIFYIIFLCFIYFTGNQILAQEILFEKLYYHYPFQASGKNAATNFYSVESFSDGGYATIGFGLDTFPNAQMFGLLTKYNCLGEMEWSKNLGFSGSGTNIKMAIING